MSINTIGLKYEIERNRNLSMPIVERRAAKTADDLLAAHNEAVGHAQTILEHYFQAAGIVMTEQQTAELNQLIDYLTKAAVAKVGMELNNWIRNGEI